MATDKADDPQIPPQPDFIARAGALLNLNVPETCREGIAANLDLLQGHAAIVAAALRAARS